jgi:hypothetical protein
MSYLLINGIPQNNFACKRGVTQGDLLSPLLYVLGRDLLQSIINLALSKGLLRLQILLDGDFPIVLYADDTIIVLPAEDDRLFLFKELLNKYAGYTGLKANYHKFSLIPINLSQQEAEHMAMVFDCQLGSMPFTDLSFAHVNHQAMCSVFLSNH